MWRTSTGGPPAGMTGAPGGGAGGAPGAGMQTSTGRVGLQTDSLSDAQWTALEALLAAATGLAGITAAHFTLGLVLLGLGWNFGFVGASAMVLETHRPEERTRVQSFNDFIVFGTMVAGSFASGQLLATLGWAAVNWVVLPPVAAAFAMLLLAGRRRVGAAA